MKRIFYNDAEGAIRAGWRMGIFTLALAAVTFLLAFPSRWVMAHNHLLPPFAANDITFYGGLVFTTWFIAKFLEHRPPFASVGLSLNANVVREVGQGVVLGGGMMSIIFVTEYGLGMVTFSFKELLPMDFIRMFGASSIIFIVGAFGEELLFRGYLFQTMIEGTGKIIAVVVFGLFFGAAHMGNPNVTTFSVINVALAGAWLSIAYFKTRALWFPIALHFSWNFFQNHIFSFPVSGIQFQKFQLGVLIQSGPSWLTGGSFGPEGGALATVMLFASGFFIYFSPWIKPSDSVWTLEQWKMKKNSHTVGQDKAEPQSQAL